MKMRYLHALVQRLAQHRVGHGGQANSSTAPPPLQLLQQTNSSVVALLSQQQALASLRQLNLDGLPRHARPQSRTMPNPK